jgi:hypothetical protein
MDILKSALNLLSSRNEDPKPKKGPAKFTPVNLKAYNAKMDTSAKSDNTKVVRQPIMSVKQSNALKAERNAAELARREKAIATSFAARDKPLSTKQLQEVTGAIGDKLRLFPNDPDSFIDEYLNPGVLVGNMASGIGSLPEDVKKGKIGKAALSVAAPLAIGALGGLGKSKTNAQFLNEVLNPGAGLTDLIPKGKLANTFKNTSVTTQKSGSKLGNIISTIKEYSPFYIEPETRAAGKFQKQELDKLLNTTEGNKRLEAMGINIDIAKKNKPSLTLNEKLKNKYSPEYGININKKELNTAKILENLPRNLSKSQIQSHELGHWLQDMYIRSNPDKAKRYLEKYNEQKSAYKAYEKLSDAEKINVKNKPLPPNPKLLKDLVLPSQIDEMAKSLKTIPLPSDDSVSRSNRSYFGGSYDANEIGEGVDVERVPMLREARQQMKDQGLIKDIYSTEINEDILKKFIEENRGKSRLASFLSTDPKTLKTLADIYKILPAAGAGVATTVATSKEKNKK